MPIKNPTFLSLTKKYPRHVASSQSVWRGGYAFVGLFGGTIGTALPSVYGQQGVATYSAY